MSETKTYIYRKINWRPESLTIDGIDSMWRAVISLFFSVAQNIVLVRMENVLLNSRHKWNHHKLVKLNFKLWKMKHEHIQPPLACTIAHQNDTNKNKQALDVADDDEMKQSGKWETKKKLKSLFAPFDFNDRINILAFLCTSNFHGWLAICLVCASTPNFVQLILFLFLRSFRWFFIVFILLARLWFCWMKFYNFVSISHIEALAPEAAEQQQQQLSFNTFLL